MQNIRKGEVKNPFARNAVGGFMGIDNLYCGDEFAWLNNIWYSMLVRATGKRREYKLTANTYLNAEAYNNVALDPKWFCYADFANWYMGYLSKLNCSDNVDYQIDKDLLYPYYSQFTRGRKCYSPFTCTLLPKSINVGIANFNSGKFMDNLNQNIENAYKNHQIDQDTYCVLKRFYVKDPNYSNYVTEKFNDMRMNLCGF